MNELIGLDFNHILLALYNTSIIVREVERVMMMMLLLKVIRDLVVAVAVVVK
jgi:hypothetical protein